MNISTRQHMIVTSHGCLAVEQSGQDGVPVLLIHGNSCCRGVFFHQMQGRLAQDHRPRENVCVKVLRERRAVPPVRFGHQ
jgi:hypothetical protein